MKIDNLKLKTIIFVLIVISHWLLVVKPAQAAEPQFLVSWRALSYVPSWYQGKTLPTRKTPIEASFELIDNGKIVDIFQEKVRWYLNDKLIRNEKDGLGIKSIRFLANDYPGQNIEMRIVIADFQRKTTLGKIINMPIVKPEGAINLPYNKNQISRGIHFFQAAPFFFNITEAIGELSFEWSVEGQPVQTGNSPDILRLDANSMAVLNSSTDIALTIKNLLNPLEFAVNNIQLTVK